MRLRAAATTFAIAVILTTGCAAGPVGQASHDATSPSHARVRPSSPASAGASPPAADNGTGGQPPTDQVSEEAITISPTALVIGFKQDRPSS